MKKTRLVVLLVLLASGTGLGCGGAKRADLPVTQTTSALTIPWNGWLDRADLPPTLVADPNSPSGGSVQEINRTAAGGDYLSPWQTVVAGQSYCLQAAVKWVGGGAPFVGVQPAGGGVIWVMGAAGYGDAFGPVAAFSTTNSGWQQLQFTVPIPPGVTQLRLANELFAGAAKDGANLAYFDVFSLTSGGCAASSVSVPYTEQFESGAGNWADLGGSAPNLASDATSPAGAAVMSVTRTGSGGDYFSPWIDVTAGQTYCAKTALKWGGTGGMPFVGAALSTAPTRPVWLIGGAGYSDAFGPLQVVSASNSGWQQFQTTLVMPASVTQMRFAVELFAGAGLPGNNAAYFDGFSLTSGACAASSVSVPYTEQFESGAGNWADLRGSAPSLASDATSPAGAAVMSVTRTGSGGDYFSPWIDVTAGQTYCAKTALKWGGTGGMPFVGAALSTAPTRPVWLIGGAGYSDTFGPLQVVSASSSGWQQFQTTLVMPESVTQLRFAVELYAGAGLPGGNAAYFDGFSLTSGACAASSVSVPYTEQFESGAGNWADLSGSAPSLASDATSPAGAAVMSVTRTGSGGDYFSPWIDVTAGQTYCAKTALKWGGTGGMPFVGAALSTAPTRPVWLIGGAGYSDTFGPLQVVSASSSGWQQFQTTLVMPESVTQLRFAVELYAGAGLPGGNAAYFDGFSLTSGSCGGSVPYTEQFEYGAGNWADLSGGTAGLANDSSSPFGPSVMSVTRTAVGGDYFSPSITVTAGQTYCAKTALKWGGTGGMPFVGAALSTAPTRTIWLIGGAGYSDEFGPVQVVSTSNHGWQQFQTTLVMPASVTQLRFAVELYAGAGLPGDNAVHFDGFSLTSGACGMSVLYTEQFESGSGNWADPTGIAPGLASDATSPAGSGVMSVTRAATGGDYFSPWIAMTGGQVYCVETAVKWLGGGMPFVGLQTSSGAATMWIIGASGNVDNELGPLQGVSYSETGWQQFRYTAAMPEGGTEARLAVELLEDARKDGDDHAYFDGFRVTEGACVTGSPTFLVQYAQEWESGAGAWADGQGNAPGLTSDSTSRAGPGVMSVSRAASAADYFSPWVNVAGGQTYCVQAAVRWLGGGTPFVGLQPSTASEPVWIIGASGYSDAFGPVQVVSASGTGWQQFQYAVPMPVGAAEARLAVKLSADVTKAGANQAYFDGFRITNGGCAPSSVLVMAPHPDDEILTSSGVTGRALLHGYQVHIAYLTNGDFGGTVQGLTREDETTSAVSVIGVGEDNLMFLGYPDGYTEDLRQTYTSPTDVMTTPNNGVAHTYAARGLARTDYHSYAFGAPAAYNWPNVLMDVASILNALLPDSIFVTSGSDGHPDHRSAYYAIVQALPQVLASHPGYKPTIYTTFVDPGDETWPNPAAPDQYFSSSAVSTLTSRGLLWSHRDSLDVPLSMQTTTLASNLKYQSLAAEVSQGGNSGYLGLFLHKDEFFWGERPANPSDLPPVVNAGLDQTTTAGATVTLNGSASFDPDGLPLSYKWIQVDGPAVALSNAGASQPSLAAPSDIVSPTTLTFELRVADDLGWSVADAVSIIVYPLY